MILSQLADLLLLLRIISGSDDIVHPPLVAGSRTEHAAHQMILAVRLCESVQRIIAVHAEILGGNEDVYKRQTLAWTYALLHLYAEKYRLSACSTDK